MQSSSTSSVNHFIETIDLKLQRPHMASSHVLVVGSAAALVDVGATQNHLQILAALREKKLSFEAVKFIFVTHIHLDHAGAAGFLLAHHFPNARLVVHPLGAPHLKDPAKLEAAAREVYGSEVYEQVYGSLVPVPSEKLLLATDGLELNLETGQIVTNQEALVRQQPRLQGCARIIHTPGHARHHYCLHMFQAGAIFTGDAYGLAYPELTVGDVAFLFPTTTPTAFEPDEMLRSMEKIAELRPSQAYLTHFGLLPQPEVYLGVLKARVLKLVELALNIQGLSGLDQEEKARLLEEHIRAWLKTELEKHGCDVNMGLMILDMDIKLNVQGLLVWLGRRQRV